MEYFLFRFRLINVKYNFDQGFKSLFWFTIVYLFCTMWSMRIHSSLLHFRFLRNVSVLLFLNKIDVLAEKVTKGRCIAELVKKYPHIFPDFDSFQASSEYLYIQTSGIQILQREYTINLWIEIYKLNKKVHDDTSDMTYIFKIIKTNKKLTN